MTFASLSPLAWSATTFLQVYAVAFFIALIWSITRRKNRNEKFRRPDGAGAILTDPYELAFLAGGKLRCVQVAVISLLQQGTLAWKKGRFFQANRLVISSHASPPENGMEREIFDIAKPAGEKGVLVQSLLQLSYHDLRALEIKLAKLGLRPTASEASLRAHSTALPLFALLALGVLRLFVGFQREEEIIFLVIFLFVTFFASLLVSQGGPKLTSDGELLLTKLRAEKKTRPVSTVGENSPPLAGVALFGISATIDDPAYTGLPTGLQKDLTQMSKQSSSGCGAGGGSGCSTGCGSGCGGGCGGCGG